MIYAFCILKKCDYSPSLHTSRRSRYLTTSLPPFPLGSQLGFVEVGVPRLLSPIIEVMGESSSSSSSSLMYDFLSSDDPLLCRLWLPTSPMMLANEAAEGGE